MMSKNDKNVTSQRMSLRAKRGNPVIENAFNEICWIATSLRSSQ
jgi:hypothetical protein